MNSTKRRSAFSVFRAQIKSTEELDQLNGGVVCDSTDSISSSGKSRKTPRKKRQGKVVGKKFTKVNTLRDLHDVGSSQESDSSEPGNKKRPLSKAHRFRQSLSLSSKKKRTRSAKSSRAEVEDLASSKRRRKSAPVFSSDEGSRSRESRVEHASGADGEASISHEETEADKIFQWLISPVKPTKFFR